MKIEKINENQIRCTLTKEDLASRQLKLSELAYGTEKAKRLFREMMQQANFEFGFEAEDIPLMIEAIPMNAECVVLLITKVEDPEELDTRFARFSPEDPDENENEDDFPIEGDYANYETNLGEPLSEMRPEGQNGDSSVRPQTKIFTFRTLSEVMNAAAQTGGANVCPNSLYKDSKTGEYLLILRQADATVEDFNRICNTLSEYGKLKRGLTRASFLEEHCEVILAENSLQSLAF